MIDVVTLGVGVAVGVPPGAVVRGAPIDDIEGTGLGDPAAGAVTDADVGVDEERRGAGTTACLPPAGDVRTSRVVGEIN